MDMALHLNFFVALLAISNPLDKVPLWRAAARDETSPVQWRLALLVVLTGGAILATFLVFGRPILAFFGIDLASFRVDGGIVVLLVGIRMLRGELVRLDYDL